MAKVAAPKVAVAVRASLPFPDDFHKTVHFVRHGQGIHNEAADRKGCGCTCHVDGDSCVYVDEAILDARLTELGVSQAKGLLPLSTPLELDLVVVSPLNRAIQTALHGFSSCSAPFLAHEDCREQMGQHICDKRNPT